MEAAPPNSSFCPVRRVSPSPAGQGPPSTLQSLDTSGIIAYLTGAMTIADVSRDCRVLGGPCPAGEGETLRTGQNEELGGAASIVAGLVLTVLGFGIGVRTKRP